MFFGKHHYTLSHHMEISDGAGLPKHGYFLRQESAFQSLFVLWESCFAWHVQQGFPAHCSCVGAGLPAPQPLAWEPFRDSSSSERLSSSLEIILCFFTSTPLYFSCRHVPFSSSFHHPDISPFSFLWNFFLFLPMSHFEF